MQIATIIKSFNTHDSHIHVACPPKGSQGKYLGEVDFEYNDKIMHRVQFGNEIFRFKSNEIEIRELQ